MEHSIFFMTILASLVATRLLIAGALLQTVHLTEQPIPGMLPPFSLVPTKPLYTVDALSQRIEGTVSIQVQVEADGNFKVLQIVKGLGYGLAESALAALRQWRFAPALSNGLPVSVVANVDVDFHPYDGGSWPISILGHTVWARMPTFKDGELSAKEISIE